VELFASTYLRAALYHLPTVLALHLVTFFFSIATSCDPPRDGAIGEDALGHKIEELSERCDELFSWIALIIVEC